MPKVEVLSDGILYRDENPGFKAEYAFLPNILPLSETEALCFYRIGAAFYSVDGKMATLRSTDGGSTWNRLNTGVEHNLYAVDASSDGVVWFVGNRGMTLRVQ